METDKSLIEELEQFRAEKEKIRMLVGQIGGKGGQKLDKIINISFIVIISILFSFDIMRHIFGIEVPIPSVFSIELGVLLVSIKIIWMIHRQAKIEHFQFWILNSIEFRLNSLAKQMKELNKKQRTNDGM